jgi:hypothetical protein
MRKLGCKIYLPLSKAIEQKKVCDYEIYIYIKKYICVIKYAHEKHYESEKV